MYKKRADAKGAVEPMAILENSGCVGFVLENWLTKGYFPA